MDQMTTGSGRGYSAMSNAKDDLISRVLTMAHRWEPDDDSRDALEDVFDAVNEYLEAIEPKQLELDL